MSKVLIVEDESDYRRQLQIGLAADGHEVRTVGDGREAIEQGARFRPDVLVTDWMLGDAVHGLQVSEAVRVVTPAAQTVLITGFPSVDLQAEAQRYHVSAFLEKPFTLGAIREAVWRAAQDAPRRSTSPPIAVLVVDHDDRVLYANPRAGELLAEREAEADVTTLQELFPPDELARLNAADKNWIEVQPISQRKLLWRVRAQPARAERTRLMVLRHPDDPHFITGATIDMLLGISEGDGAQWPFAARVLVVCSRPLERRLALSMLETAGAGCYGSPCAGADALQLLRNDEGIGYVILDCNVPAEEMWGFVGEIRRVRPEIVVIGCADPPSDETEGEKMLYLTKPWRAETLINLITGRLGPCRNCGYALPLRRPQPDESAQAWICRGCETRYTAVWDEALSGECGGNVAPAE